MFKEQQAVIQSQQANLAAVIAEAISTKINQAITEFEKNSDYCSEFTDFTEEEFDKFGFTGLPEAINQVFIRNGIPLNIQAILPSLRRLIFLVLKAKSFYNFFSGLVFAGYGELEIFPGLTAVNVSIGINKRLRIYDDKNGTIKITHQSMSAIRPFAQTDVINTVLSGIDPGLNRLYLQQFQDFILKNNTAIAQLIETASPEIAGKIRAIDIDTLTKTLNTLISRERKRHYIDPLMGAVSTLSKEDLAEMAESLVYLTYLKRRFTFAEESVGGPVDVAIITKGDGFVWIKRKHYFKQELNPHFFKNY